MNYSIDLQNKTANKQQQQSEKETALNWKQYINVYSVKQNGKNWLYNVLQQLK